MPSADQWMEQWSLPGNQGGMLATRVSWTDVYNEHQESAFSHGGPLPMKDANHTTAATWDLKRLKYHCRVTTKRKSCPKHSVPAAILAMLMDPNVNMDSKAATRSRGLGIDVTPISAVTTYEVLHEAYSHLNRCGFTPLK